MKKKLLSAIAIIGALAITGCVKPKASSNNSVNPDSSAISSNTGDNSSTSKTDPVEDFPITIPTQQGIRIEANKKRAVKGEKITLTVTLDPGYKLIEIKVTNATVTKESNTTYSFAMPERSVRVTATLEIDGDFVLVGDFSAELVKEGDIYVARNVSIPYAGDYAEFSYVVQKDGVATKLPSLALDETRCFANVSFTTSKDNELKIARGCTYDFFYDPSDSERPCYVIRKSVDSMPLNGDALFTRVFDGRMRSEPTNHAPDLVAIDYTYDTDSLKYSYNYKKYAQDASLATITDTTDQYNVKNYYVYKHADWTKNIYEVVNTWSKDLGNNENEYALWELDPYASDDINGKSHQPFSAKLDITPDETDTRLEISKRDVVRNIGMGAHYGQELEYEFYDAYRAVFGDVYINAPSWTNPGFSCTANADGSFKVTINSTVEYNREASSGSVDVEDHSGHTNNLVINFLKNGAVKDLTWTRGDYNQAQWDFVNHAPRNASNGTIKRVTCTNTYGNAYAGAPTFDASKYFISNITAASWDNKDNTEERVNGVSSVCFGDTLEFYPYGNGGKKSSICKEFAYTPSTALDAWQYGVVSAENPNIVGLNGQRRYEVLNVGQTTVTISNRTANSATVTTNVTIKSMATKCALGFYVDFRVAGYDSYNCADSTTLIAKAGKTSTYYVDVSSESGKKAPVSYSFSFIVGKDSHNNYIYSDTSEYLTYTTEGHKLTINCNTEASNALTENKTITAYVTSDYYQPGRPETEFTIIVLAKNADDDLIGSHWMATYVDDNGVKTDDQTDIYFYTQHADGYADNVYKGKITDYVAGTNDSYFDEFEFVYEVNNMGLIVAAQITKVTFETPSFVGAKASNFNLFFGGVENVNGQNLLLVCMWYEDSENIVPFFGSGYWDEEYQVPNIESYAGFTKVRQ